MTTLSLLLAAMLSVPAQGDTLHAVDVYGLRTLSDSIVRMAIGVRAGDPVPRGVSQIRARLLALPNVEDAEISSVCCADNGRSLLYVGVRERGTPPLHLRAAPAGDVRLPAGVLALGERYTAALTNAVRRGTAGEDRSQGYALAADPALRAVQEEFLRVASRDAALLAQVLQHSSDAAHRALAAQLLAYAPDRAAVTQALLTASDDPAEPVRNNAVRALAVIAEWQAEQTRRDIVIPVGPFVQMLHSVSWTDRNKGVMMLMALTIPKDSAVLTTLRTRAGVLDALAEMARWTNPGHAFPPYIVLARIAGVDDGEAFAKWQAGEREWVIARAQERSRSAERSERE